MSRELKEAQQAYQKILWYYMPYFEVFVMIYFFEVALKGKQILFIIYVLLIVQYRNMNIHSE